MKDVACMRVQESGSRSAHSSYASLSVSLAGAGALLASIVLTASSLAQPQGWPQRPVKVLVPFAAGGNIDLMGRLAAARLSETLAQQFVVENRVGGNGVIATEAVARARPDGYTLLWASTQDQLRSGEGSGAHQPVRRGAASAARQSSFAGARRFRIRHLREIAKGEARLWR